MRLTWNHDMWEDIGGGTEITFYVDEETGDRIGLLERHVCAGGRLSAGSIPFAGMPALGNLARWTVNQVDPLTISPSIACQACSHHGWIRNGRWVDA